MLGEATEKRHEVVDYAEKLLGFAVNQLKKLLRHDQVFSLNLFPGHRQVRQCQLAEAAVRLHGDFLRVRSRMGTDIFSARLLL